MRFGWLGFIALFAMAAAGAQERGRDAADYVPTEFRAFGAWELYCGHFGDPKAETCDLRRTDILSPRPNFRAMVVSWSIGRGGARLDVGAERTTTWLGGGIKIDGERVVAFDRCVVGRCIVQGEEAAALIARLARAKAVAVALTDALTLREIDWDLADMRAGLAALTERTRKNFP
jgi:invasion protein IalB